MTDLPAYDQTLARLRKSRWARRAARFVLGAALIGYFAFALVFLSVRYLVLPRIEEFRGDIERALSAGISLPVGIAHIEASWRGLQPNLALLGFVVRDREGRPALALDRVEAELSWRSLLSASLRLARLEIVAPTLNVRRDAAGKIFVAGLPLAMEGDRGGFADWLLGQDRIVISGATVSWLDEQRGAPPLSLTHLNFQLSNDGMRHRFGLTADPPRPLAARIDLRGDFRGEPEQPPQEWAGEAYAELAYADLAIWRAWVDYPFELSSGSGGLRLWLSLAGGRLDKVSAELALAGVEARLAPGLPPLKLRQVSGRLSGQQRADGIVAGARGLTLVAADGLAITPSDFQLNWTQASAASPARGEFTANGLDLGAMAQLAAFLPLAPELRRWLAAARPRGKVFDLALSWKQPPDAPADVKLRSRFAGLGLQAQGALPGFEGLSGSIDGGEAGGVLKLDSHNAVIEMPAVFADPKLALATLSGEAGWTTGKDGIEIKLAGFNFGNHDALGTLSGSYILRQGQPGVIDLSARLTRADGGAVWRYMPLGVNRRVRDWLQSSIGGGKASEATLRLKGDLARFPFAAGDGVFEVRGKFSGAKLHYAEGWPQIDNISGELAFIGSRMTIKASKGSIYGVGISEVTAQIDDLSKEDEILVITGRANGPTGEFLRFIENSPVAARIDHFTEEMSATGNGRLDLKLTMPLQHVADSRTEGSFQFANNRLSPAPGAPMLTELGGRLEFTGDALRAERLRANLLGSPVTAELRTRTDGSVLLNADGGVSIAALRKQYELPVLEHLSGTASWHLSARLRGRNVDVVVDSRLLGISSSLPEPLNKSALEALPLRFERRLLADAPRRGAPARAGMREQIDISLGNAVAARLLRRAEPSRPREAATLERGAIAVGLPLVLPEKGLLVAVRQQKLDLDLWRTLLRDGSSGASLPITQVDLKAGELTIFGRRVSELGLIASARDSGWHVALKGPDVQGELDWAGGGSGRLSGRLQELVLNPAAATGGGASYTPEELPGLDIQVERFLLGDKAFGRLKIHADNRAGAWEAKLDVDNEDGKLSGTGSWQSKQERAATNMKFVLEAKSVEKLLARFGYPDAVRRGQATLEGSLRWDGSPLSIDYASLDGNMALIASAGQFNKLEPGAGRLLGILSLQSLPRRISLDFRDVFSQGFAFDSIAGQVAVQRGIMSAKELRIQGPAAKIVMSGTVDLPRETQNLKVHVQPAIGESLSVGAILLAHPAAGAIAFLVQKLLRDPIDQAFAYEYSVTGTWADPKVEKVGAPQQRDTSKVDRGQE